MYYSESGKTWEYESVRENTVQGKRQNAEKNEKRRTKERKISIQNKSVHDQHQNIIEQVPQGAGEPGVEIISRS
jgi:hypothetical protein